MPDRILLEIDVETLNKLISCRALCASEFSCVDSQGKRCMQQLFLQQVSRKLHQELCGKPDPSQYTAR